MTTKDDTKGHAHTAHAHAHADKAKADHKPAKADDEKAASDKPVNHIEGEHITQHKPTIGEGMAMSGGNATMDDIGKGSVVEEAPAVRSAVSDTDRVVQQGDEVVVHGRGIIDGQTEIHGRVLKVNQNGSIAVRVTRGNGQTFDIPGEIHNRDLGDGSNYFTWPAEGEESLLPLDKSA
jgi:hypothetical protein